MKTKFFNILILISCWGALFAQKTKKDTITYDVVVVGSYEPKLLDFPKKLFSPQLLIDSVKKPSFDYQIFSKYIPLNIELTPIKPAQIKGDFFTELKNNYLRAGLGSRNQYSMDLYVVTGRDKNKTAGIYAHHNSINGKLKNYGYPGRAFSGINAFYNKYWPKFVLQTMASYDYYRLHWYGYNTTIFGDSLNKSNTLQYYHKPRIQLHMYTSDVDSMAWLWDGTFSYQGFMDKFHFDEHTLSTTQVIQKKVHLMKGIKHEEFQVNADGFVWFNHFDTLNTSNGLVEIVPAYSIDLGPLTIKAHINTSLQLDSIGDVYFFPGVKMQVNLFPNVISMYGGFDGNLSYASKYFLFDQNPFVDYRTEYRYMKTSSHLYGGVEGNIFSKWNYNVLVQNKKIENHPFFVQSKVTNANNTFAVRYDTLNWLQVLVEQQIEFLPRFKAGITAIFNEAQPVHETKAWYIPRWQIDGFIQYNLQNKILFTPQVSYLSKRYALFYESSPVVKELEDVIIVNLSLEYIYSKTFSFYLDFYNLLNQKYSLWYNYPMYGFSLMGGVKYAF
jgi:hypothetical protein